MRISIFTGPAVSQGVAIQQGVAVGAAQPVYAAAQPAYAAPAVGYAAQPAFLSAGPANFGAYPAAQAAFLRAGVGYQQYAAAPAAAVGHGQVVAYDTGALLSSVGYSGSLGSYAH